MEHTGLEPVASTLPVWRAPNCANAPCTSIIITFIFLNARKISPILQIQATIQPRLFLCPKKYGVSPSGSRQGDIPACPLARCLRESKTPMPACPLCSLPEGIKTIQENIFYFRKVSVYPVSQLLSCQIPAQVACTDIHHIIQSHGKMVAS